MSEEIYKDCDALLSCQQMSKRNLGVLCDCGLLKALSAMLIAPLLHASLGAGVYGWKRQKKKTPFL